MLSNKIQNLLIIGISGVTCGGKTTTATKLNNVLPKSKIFTQDDYFRDVDDPKHVWLPELNHINFDIISSLDMEKMHKDVLNFIEQNNFNQIQKENPGKHSNDFTLDDDVYQKIKKSDIFVLIIEGFSIFNYEPWLNLFNLKYYFLLDKDECYRRRLKRIYEPPDVPGYFEKCVWPYHLKMKEEIKENVSDIQFLENVPEDIFCRILKDISKYF